MGTGSVDGPSVLMEGVRGEHEHHNQQTNDEEEDKGWFAISLLQLVHPYAATCGQSVSSVVVGSTVVSRKHGRKCLIANEAKGNETETSYQQHDFQDRRFKMEDKLETQTQIDDILSQAEEQKKLSHKATEVFKEAEPIIDVGNLLLSDQQPISLPEFR